MAFDQLGCGASLSHIPGTLRNHDTHHIDDVDRKNKPRIR